jgi:Transcriptional regulator
MGTQCDACTKERLLDAGREVFAERGLQDATVREICTKAGANIAAVNYHFGGKEKLFMAVLANFLQTAQKQYPPDMGVTPGATAPERLRAYIRSLLYRLAGSGDSVYDKLGHLFTSEMIEPSEHFAEIAETYIMPQHEILLGIVREILPPTTPERTIQLCATCVIGPCVLFDHARNLIRAMRPDMALEALGVELVADFVLEFALAGIERMKSYQG